MPLTTVALDLEGTLISNAVSQLPRPGLHRFLVGCFERYDVLVFTAVREARTRRIIDRLVAEGDVPAALGAAPYVPWVGAHKDLRFLHALRPGLDIAQARLVDDLEEYVHPEQRHLWVPIRGWHAPYPQDDDELARVAAVLENQGRPCQEAGAR